MYGKLKKELPTTMTTPRPQTIGSEILAAIEDLFKQDAAPSQIELARLERDARKLIGVDAAQGYVMLGAISALAWDASQALKHVQNAIKLDSSAESLINCAITLRYVGLIEEAVELVSQAAAKAPGNQYVINTAVEWLAGAGRLNQAAALQTASQRRCIPLNEDTINASALHLAAEEISIPMERITFEVKCAHTVLANYQKRMRGFTIECAHDPDGSRTLVITMGFIGTTTEEIRLESELALLLADEPGWDPCRLAIELKHLHQDACQYA